MNSGTKILALCAILIAFVLPAASMHAAAAGWNHTYPDPEGDVSLANIDITKIRSYADGSDVVLEMTLRGSVENDSETVYWIHVGSQTSNVGMMWADGNGIIYYAGGQGFDTQNISAIGHVITGRLPQSHAGAENDFDIYGYAVRTTQSLLQFDWSGPGYQGGGEVNPGNILGMALWAFALLLLIPIIVIVVVVIILLTRKKKTPEQPQYPPPQQYPPQYPPTQQYPPPQQPPQQNQPRPPGQ